jgi:hypothetical protein
VKSNCADCNPCPHGKVKSNCADCNPCPHGKLKYNCAACKATRAGQPPLPEVKPDSEVKLEVKLEPEIKQAPFTIRGYFGLDG